MLKNGRNKYIRIIYIFFIYIYIWREREREEWLVRIREGRVEIYCISLFKFYYLRVSYTCILSYPSILSYPLLSFTNVFFLFLSYSILSYLILYSVVSYAILAPSPILVSYAFQSFSCCSYIRRRQVF